MFSLTIALSRLGKPGTVPKIVVVLGLTWFVLGWAETVPISLQQHFSVVQKPTDTLQER